MEPRFGRSARCMGRSARPRIPEADRSGRRIRGRRVSTRNAPLSTHRRGITESAVALFLAVGGSLFTVGIVALPDHAGAPPLHAELHHKLGPIERVWQESDGDSLLKPLGLPEIWSLECDTDFGTLDLVKCDRTAERIRIQTDVRAFSTRLIRGGLAEFQTNGSPWRIHSENQP